MAETPEDDQLVLEMLASIIDIDLSSDDPFANWSDPTQSITYSAANILTIFIPAGAVGKVFKAGSVGSKIAKGVGVVVELIGPGVTKLLEFSGRIARGELKVGDILRGIKARISNAVTIFRDGASGPPRLEAPQLADAPHGVHPPEPGKPAVQQPDGLGAIADELPRNPTPHVDDPTGPHNDATNPSDGSHVPDETTNAGSGDHHDGGDAHPSGGEERTDQTGIDAPQSGTKYEVNTEFADGAYTYDRTPDPARVAADKAWNAANDQLRALGERHGMSPGDLNKGRKYLLDELDSRGASYGERLRAEVLWDARKDAMTSRVETGEAMAQAEVDHLIVKQGEVPVNGAGELTGRGTFDHLSYPKGDPTQITIWEAKGGYQGKSPGTFLEKANVPDSSGGTITAQQGSTPYVNSLIKKDPALLQHLKGLTDEQLGRVQFSYNVVHVQPNGVVKVYPVKLDASKIDLHALKAVVRAG